MYYNMITFLRFMLIVFLFSNKKVQAKMSIFLKDILKFLDDAFEHRVGEIYNNRFIEDDLTSDNEVSDNEVCDNEVCDNEVCDNEVKIENDKSEDKSKNEDLGEEKPKETKFEDKYLEKFKAFKNEYYFTEDEKLLEEQKYAELLNIFNRDKEKGLKETGDKIDKLQEIFNKGGINTVGGVEVLTRYYNIEAEYEDNPEDYDLQELIDELSEIRDETKKEYDEFLNMKFSEEETRKEAKQHVLDKKLAGFINNYVLEFTPQGNVYMRYNSSKKSFEYFSNNTIPYRYLEPVGRKYVTTYFCKPLFIDIDDELKKAQDKKDQEQQEKKEQQDKKDELEKDGKGTKEKERDIYAKLKSYNNDPTTAAIMKTKNRQMGAMSLPPQIQANLPNVNSSTAPEKMLLKENANRYTWEGRMSNLSLIKKVEKKHTDKNYEMSFADFKKMQR
jgi:hypothetical protein